jgi:hypothetical protein
MISKVKLSFNIDSPLTKEAVESSQAYEAAIPRKLRIAFLVGISFFLTGIFDPAVYPKVFNGTVPEILVFSCLFVGAAILVATAFAFGAHVNRFISLRPVNVSSLEDLEQSIDDSPRCLKYLESVGAQNRPLIQLEFLGLKEFMENDLAELKAKRVRENFAKRGISLV